MTPTISSSNPSSSAATESETAKPKPRQAGVGETRSREDILAAQAIPTHGDLFKTDGLAYAVSSQE